MNYEEIKLLPKVELHLHLDCSLSYNVVKKLKPSIAESDYMDLFVAPEKCHDLADFLKCTVGGIELMQNRRGIQFAVDDLFSQLKEDNVIYSEIRFAPLQHLERGLEPEEVVETAAERIEYNSRLYNIPAGLILCTLRHYSAKESLETVKLVERYISSTCVAGFDIAADEAGFSVDEHIAAFRYANEKLLPCTAHAGEAKGPDSVRETIKHFGVGRLGHGVRSIEDPELIEYLVENGIHLEICPTCNIQTDIYHTYSEHPVDFLYNKGISLGINTDARSLVNITLNNEYQKLNQYFGWETEHFFRCNNYALDAAFIDSEKRVNLKNILKTSLK